VRQRRCRFVAPRSVAAAILEAVLGLDDTEVSVALVA
jgi:hypothetical protein